MNKMLDFFTRYVCLFFMYSKNAQTIDTAILPVHIFMFLRPSMNIVAL